MPETQNLFILGLTILVGFFFLSIPLILAEGLLIRLFLITDKVPDVWAKAMRLSARSYWISFPIAVLLEFARNSFDFNAKINGFVLLIVTSVLTFFVYFHYFKGKIPILKLVFITLLVRAVTVGILTAIGQFG